MDDSYTVTLIWENVCKETLLWIVFCHDVACTVLEIRSSCSQQQTVCIGICEMSIAILIFLPTALVEMMAQSGRNLSSRSEKMTKGPLRLA